MSNEANLPETIDGVPNLCGQEALIEAVMGAKAPPLLRDGGVDFSRARATFANALHMQQPLIPAGGADLKTAHIISNLKLMWGNQGYGDNHNAPVFHWCYKRMGEFIPQLVHEGKRPRIMMEYSGCLLHGLRDMGLHDTFDALRPLAQDHALRNCVEWLGAPWSHAVAPSTPVQDYRLHVKAWQHHFAAIFGLEAVSRVRGFSPSEMALPNHPDVAYEFVKTLKDCGFRWVLVQEHTVEPLGGSGPIPHRYVPNQLVVKNSRGETLTITAIIKTQGSDTKLVAQMQPYYEARSMSRQPLAGQEVPALVTQVADGENGGVMMNEFPPKFLEVMRESTGTDVPAANVSEYLEYLDSLGIDEDDYPKLQPIHQTQLWNSFTPGAGPAALKAAIEKLRTSDHRFHMDGGSWTSDISWVRGYDDLLGPMEEASALFSERVLAKGIATSDSRYRRALYHLLVSQTSCYRYWGSGTWTDYGKEICRRAIEIIRSEL